MVFARVIGEWLAMERRREMELGKCPENGYTKRKGGGLDYYVYRNERQLGPYTMEQVQGFLKSREVSLTDLCWNESLPGWVAISTVFQSPAKTVLPQATLAGPGITSTRHSRRRYALKGHPGFGLRVAAYLIDSLALRLLMYSVTPYMRDWFALHPMESWRVFLVSFGFFYMINWVYYAVLESSPLQATPGKKLCGFIVTDRHGNRIGFWRASLRFWGMLVSTLTLGIGYLMCGYTRKNQCLHDQMSGCLMYRI